MNDSASGAVPKTWAAPLTTWWQGLGARERRLLVWGGAVLGVVLVWALAVQPAWRTLALAPSEHEKLDSQLQQMQRDAAESLQLRALPPMPAEEAAAALRAVTDRLGSKARLVLQGERATVSFTGVGPAALRDWFSEARAGARVRPVEANLARGPQGFNGTVVLALGGNP